MDRNTSIDNLTQGVFNVALRKESVDRNGVLCVCMKEVLPSLSVRRAWIEMLQIGLMLVASLGRSP